MNLSHVRQNLRNRWYGWAIFSFLMAGLLFWPSQGLIAQGGHAIVLTWTAPTTGGAPTSYNVKRSTTTGTETTIASVPVPTTTYSDTTGVGGTKYFYVVTAVNATGESGPSNEASATFFLAAPGAPGSLAATSN